MLELCGVFVGFFNTEHGANLLQKIGQFRQKLGVSFCNFGKVQHRPVIRGQRGRDNGNFRTIEGYSR